MNKEEFKKELEEWKKDLSNTALYLFIIVYYTTPIWSIILVCYLTHLMNTR